LRCINLEKNIIILEHNNSIEYLMWCGIATSSSEHHGEGEDHEGEGRYTEEVPGLGLVRLQVKEYAGVLVCGNDGHNILVLVIALAGR
jgi:hypothetical protein